ncbi:MFS transporter small subunit [Streptomyces aureoverticillatus]|uniref:MFS transporter small subunit n=1 Tax=Streptomyces aureoverticillatus TaxID=66871 RepID=UPI004047E4C4
MTTQPNQPQPNRPPTPMTPSARPSDPASPRRRPLIVGSWLWVGLPLAYGVYELVHKAKQLFTG